MPVKRRPRKSRVMLFAEDAVAQQSFQMAIGLAVYSAVGSGFWRRIDSAQLALRDRRIMAAIDTGESISSVAEREQTSRRGVRCAYNRAHQAQVMERVIINALRVELPAAFDGALSRAFPGEQVRLYSSKLGASKRDERDRRIEAAANAGQRVADIAKREGMSQFGVRKAIARIRATSAP